MLGDIDPTSNNIAIILFATAAPGENHLGLERWAEGKVMIGVR